MTGGEIEAGRAAMPPEPISQEAALAMLAALRMARMGLTLFEIHPSDARAVERLVGHITNAIALAERH